MNATLRKYMSKVVVGLVVLAVVAGGLYFFVFRASGQKTVSARFPAAVGVYPGTPVKILGVQVGDVTAVSPKAGYVEVKMEYSSSYKLPAKGGALEVANSLVSDRYIQLSPVYKSGPIMKSGASIPASRTGAPAELDDIYSALNKLSVALGPAGANKGGQKGALSAIVDVGAANLKGNGAALGNSISKLSQAASTLADNKGNLFATVRNLQQFTTTLKNSDADVRNFNTQLQQAASDLASERADLGSALHNLGLALDAVSGFVKKNATKFHTDFQGLRVITGILVKQKASVNETLALAPAALSNIVHAYQPNVGALATRSNLASLTNLSPDTLKGLVCDKLTSLTSGVPLPGPLGGLSGGLGVLGGNVKTACTGLTIAAPSIVPGASSAPKTPAALTSPGVPTVPGAGLSGLSGALTGAGS